jgi:hypothetical protein
VWVDSEGRSSFINPCVGPHLSSISVGVPMVCDTGSLAAASVVASFCHLDSYTDSFSDICMLET